MRGLSSYIALALCGIVAADTSTSHSGVTLAPALRGKRSFYKRDGVERTVFTHDALNSSIDYVTNSGICETTPGVNQYSGYLHTGSELPSICVPPERF